jgi:hypothetical protein
MGDVVIQGTGTTSHIVAVDPQAGSVELELVEDEIVALNLTQVRVCCRSVTDRAVLPF